MFTPGPMQMLVLGLVCVVPIVAVIVVLVVVFIVRRGKTPPPIGANFSSCPDCGQAVSIAATECPSCGCHLPTQPDG